MQRFIGLSIQVPSRTLATKRCGWRVERGSPVWSTRADFPVTDATSTLKGSSRVGNTLHVYVEEKEWELNYRPVNNSGEQNVLALILHGHPLFCGLKCA